MDKSLLFLFLSFLFIWLILDQFYGKKIVGNFIDNLLGIGDGVVDTQKYTTTQTGYAASGVAK